MDSVSSDGGAARPHGILVCDTGPAVRPGAGAVTAFGCLLPRLSVSAHAAAIHAATCGHDALWDYLPVGPFASKAALATWMDGACAAEDPCLFAIPDPKTGQAGGFAALMRIQPDHRVIEIGFITLGPGLQRGRAGSLALMAMIGWAFENGYRRVEWKCNALNAASRRAALRLGFSYEGLFRQHMIVKGRNRDTAWYAIIDRDWPALCGAYEAWLSPANFDPAGRQRQRLSALTQAAVPGRADG